MDSGWALLGLALALALVVQQGFRALSGSAAEQRLRRRPEGASAEEWLLGSAARPHCAQGLPGLLIRCGRSAAAVREWQADVPPPLATSGPSHLWGLLPRWLFRDIVIRPPPVEIDAPPHVVWEAFIDFDSYAEWNPFHRKVEVVEQGEGSDAHTVSVRMTVAMGPILGTLVSTEAIGYVDSQRHILMYSAEHPSALRMAWLLNSPSGGTIFHSYDMIGGYPALFSRGHIVGVVLRGFTAQHEALRARVHSLVGRRQKAAGDS